MGRVLGPSQEPGGDQGFERVFHLREVIPDILGQAFADEEGPRMPIEEQQEIEIARVLQAPDSIKEIADSPWRHARWHHARSPEDARPPKGGQRGAKILTGRSGPVELMGAISKSASAAWFLARTPLATSTSLELMITRRSYDCLGLPYGRRRSKSVR